MKKNYFFLSILFFVLTNSSFAQPADQNFDGQSTALIGGLSTTISGVTYSQSEPSTGTSMATFPNSIGQSFFVIEGASDFVFGFNLSSSGAISSAPKGSVDFRIMDSAGSEFKLVTMVVEVANNGVNSVNNNFTVSGYRDGTLVTSDVLNVTLTDSTGSISYSLNVGSANGGTLTFDSNWSNIDEIRFTGGSNTTRSTLVIDDIDFASPILLSSTLLEFTNKSIRSSNGKFISTNSSLNIEIYNTLGQKVSNESLSPGIYILKVTDENGDTVTLKRGI